MGHSSSKGCLTGYIVPQKIDISKNKNEVKVTARTLS